MFGRSSSQQHYYLARLQIVLHSIQFLHTTLASELLLILFETLYCTVSYCTANTPALQQRQHRYICILYSILVLHIRLGLNSSPSWELFQGPLIDDVDCIARSIFLVLYVAQPVLDGVRVP